ncbi:NRDE family protein [Microbacterium sp. zg.Y1090]|uniref:NRDE family protein n=1 Tax=Microbacterium TaxID=33882 RepID=UPI00214B4EDD|nr:MULTISPECIES: NRDE family protein [unclassified Microbacterium]MCR2813826.1 NRDE family protein [Microbacterium sp. zg.Y1084]MCR2819660.1 NRDE family protein [Microbacterium sp. zg.Y1090]MDL5487508.1 NRDE family protein [Microbacterium sp. zg-Y1211]WIM28095.1 NRDE family protein [Microbacterium sp. zg-Y1090]
MCTVIVRVPEEAGAPVQLIAVRDEDPGRPWDPLGRWWPQTHPGVVGVRDRRAGGAWLAADPMAHRLAVVLNRADLSDRGDDEVTTRGRLALESVAGNPPAPTPTERGFNLVEVDAAGVRVVSWDGVRRREQRLTPGTHMIAHDDVDDPNTPRIAAWLDRFRDAADGAGPDGFAPWLAVLDASAALDPEDDRAIIRDNRPFGYPTLSLLLCTATVGSDGVDVRYGAFDRPGHWQRDALGVSR